MVQEWFFFRQASKSNFGLLRPWPLTSWAPKMTIAYPCPGTTCANLHWNRFIHCHNITFTIGNERTSLPDINTATVSSTIHYIQLHYICTYMYNRLHSIPACARQTDGQISWHGIVRAMHTRRAVKIVNKCHNEKLQITHQVSMELWDKLRTLWPYQPEHMHRQNPVCCWTPFRLFRYCSTMAG